MKSLVYNLHKTLSFDIQHPIVTVKPKERKPFWRLFLILILALSKDKIKKIESLAYSSYKTPLFNI